MNYAIYNAHFTFWKYKYMILINIKSILTYERRTTMFKRFDSKHLFNNALQNGITLFCGSGFSVMANDVNGDKLPVGAGLLTELKSEFEDISDYNNLPRACTKIIRSDKGRFYQYLEQRFTVENFDPLYFSLTKINIKNIFTTNIDDLFFKIWDKTETTIYLHDRTQGAEYNEELKIDYFPLHGCVKNKKNYVFGATEIATAFSQKGHENAWRNLAKESANNPILFWGWNFEDSGPIEAMYGNDNNIDDNIERWVLLYNPTSETIDYLESLKFNIIIGDTYTMLKYLDELEISCNTNNPNDIELSTCLIKYCMPQNDSKLPSYSIDQYFIDYTPHWSYIYSGVIPRLSYYTNISETIASKKNVIVIGIRCSGKTTLMMQLLYGLKTNKPKYYMVAPSLKKVKAFFQHLDNQQCILFVDDCFSDTDAVVELLKNGRVQVVMFDRDFNFERQYHRICDQTFEKIDITEIKKTDAQNIIDIIPRDLKKPYTTTKHFYKDPTILNLLAANLKAVNFKFINDFYKKDADAAKVFLMVCYVHSCGVPCSFDMIYSFLGDDEYTWDQMFDIIERIGGLLTDLSILNEEYSFMDSLQNYYQCRSRYFAEKIISSIPKNNTNFKKVLCRFTENVPQYKICQYDKFRRSAYDAKIISKAFVNVDEGEEFYLKCSEKDDSEYIYQQAALYFAEAKEYKTAFEWIDKARSIAHYNRFSIDSTYAQIYFDVNIEADEIQAYKALKILEECCDSDKRRILHVEEFSTRAMKYHEKYHNKESEEIIKKALKYVEDSISKNNIITSQINKWRLEEVKMRLNHSLTDNK